MRHGPGNPVTHNALLSGRLKWHVFAKAKQVSLLPVRWSYLLCAALYLKYFHLQRFLYRP